MENFVANVTSESFSLKTVWYWFAVCLHTRCKIQAKHCAGSYRFAWPYEPSDHMVTKNNQNFSVLKEQAVITVPNTHAPCHLVLGGLVNRSFRQPTWFTSASGLCGSLAVVFLFYQSVLTDSNVDWVVEGGMWERRHLKGNGRYCFLLLLRVSLQGSCVL